MTSLYTDLDVLYDHLVLVVPFVQVNHLYMNLYYQVAQRGLQNLCFLYVAHNKMVNR